MKLDSKLSKISATNADIAYFSPKKLVDDPWATEVGKIKTQRDLLQILANFEQELGLPIFTEGTTEEVLNARICRYLFVSQGWNNTVSPDELTSASMWTVLVAA